MTDDNVTIVRRKHPPAVHTEIKVQRLEPIHVTVRFSADSERYLRRMGYSQRFCDALRMLLQTMTNRVINSADNEETLRHQRERHSPYLDFTAPEQPIRSKMPTNLKDACMFFGEEPDVRLMPNLGPYFPTTTEFPDVYRAFMSGEGQRFMRRYYITGWLRQDERTGEWIVAPPASPRDTVASRRE